MPELQVSRITKHWNYSKGEYEYRLWGQPESDDPDNCSMLQLVNEEVGLRNAKHYAIAIEEIVS